MNRIGIDCQGDTCGKSDILNHILKTSLSRRTPGPRTAAQKLKVLHGINLDPMLHDCSGLISQIGVMKIEDARLILPTIDWGNQ